MQNAPDVVAAGRVLATLDDWRALMYIMVITLVLFAALIISLVRALLRRSGEMQEERKAMAAERERMWGVSEKFGDAADKLGGETNKVVTELQVQRALSSRFESLVSRMEARLSQRDKRT